MNGNAFLGMDIYVVLHRCIMHH